MAASAWTMVALGHEVAVEDVAGDQDGRRLVPRGELGDRAHGREARLAQERRHLAGRLWNGLPSCQSAVCSRRSVIAGRARRQRERPCAATASR